MSDNKNVTKTTVGPTIVIRGKLNSGEDLIVKGRIDAEITSSKALFIENSGIVKANVNVESAKISGVLVGDVSAKSKTEIAADGRMVGDILAPKIVISDGAKFRGRIDMPGFEEARAGTEKEAEKGAPAKTPKAAADAPSPAGKQAPAKSTAKGSRGPEAIAAAPDRRK